MVEHLVQFVGCLCVLSHGKEHVGQQVASLGVIGELAAQAVHPVLGILPEGIVHEDAHTVVQEAGTVFGYLLVGLFQQGGSLVGLLLSDEHLGPQEAHLLVVLVGDGITEAAGLVHIVLKHLLAHEEHLRIHALGM